MATPVEQLGLRERKKQRTRQTIVDVALRLFAERGFTETTLVEIADAAEIAPSTFFNYFPTKVDIVFGFMDVVIQSARERILERPEDESATDAVLAWVAEELPSVERPYNEALRSIPRVIASVEELRSEERLRLATLEDILAASFARDLGESSESMSARVMAAIALRGMRDVWNAWYAQHSADLDFDARGALELKAEYLERALDAGLEALKTFPRACG